LVYRLVITPEQKQEQKITLTPEQQHYLFRVLRLKNGDRFVAMDGYGNSWLAEITAKSANIIESIDISTELPVPLTLITALPKGSGYEQVVRCCTELGVSTFLPVISDRTLLKPNPNKVDRWRKIATEAAEQSERQIVPAILDPIKFALAMNSVDQPQAKYICAARGNLPTLASCLQTKQEAEIVIATGCEGGWTDAEIEIAIAVGYQPVSLGNRILRAVTAPIVALSLAVAALEKI
jgi:16S rRNA (uracil1498-N3)-methyltransferase